MQCVSYSGGHSLQQNIWTLLLSASPERAGQDYFRGMFITVTIMSPAHARSQIDAVKIVELFNLQCPIFTASISTGGEISQALSVL